MVYRLRCALPAGASIYRVRGKGYRYVGPLIDAEPRALVRDQVEALLRERAGEVVPCSEIAALLVWSKDRDNTLKTHICKLRARLADTHTIENVYGRGYRLEARAKEAAR